MKGQQQSVKLVWAGLKATPGPRTRECSHRGLTPGLVGLRGTERPHPLLAPDTPITAPFLGVLCSTPLPQATPVFSSLLGRRFLCLLLGMVLMKEEHLLCRVESASSRRMSWGVLVVDKFQHLGVWFLALISLSPGRSCPFLGLGLLFQRKD